MPIPDLLVTFAASVRADRAANPEYVEDYWEALARLARMPTPSWYRTNPDGQGGWGLITAQEGWRRFACADLERMVSVTQAGEG